MDTLMPSLKALPHLSHLFGLASPWMSTYCTEGDMQLGRD